MTNLVAVHPHNALQPRGWRSSVGAPRSRDVNSTNNTRTTSPSNAAWWVGLLLLHCINIAYYVGAATLYTSYERTYTYIALRLLSIGIDNKEYHKVSAIHATIAAIHAAFVLLMIGSSIHARKLVFQPNFDQIIHVVTRNPWVGWFRSLVIAPLSRVYSKCTRSSVVSSLRSISRATDSFGATGSLIFSREGLLGVDSVYFDHVLLLREFVETGLQTYQVYRMSQLLPRLWLIRFYVALLVANCWVVPFLHRYYRHRETTRRMLCLVCDAVLDMVSSVGVSLMIFATYAPQYVDPAGFGFPYVKWFDDEWLASMQQELEMMLVASWGDMISRLVFALGLLQCMDAIKDMLTPAGEATTHRESTSAKLSSRLQDGADGVRSIAVTKTSMHIPTRPTSTGNPDVAPGQNPFQQETTSPKLDRHHAALFAKSAKSPRNRGRLPFLVNVVGPGTFVVWGFIIIVIHLIAESHYSDVACELRLKPWLSTKPGCSIVEINCHRIQSNGHDEIMATALDTFDAERAARVTFRHCPELVITPKFREFKNMAGLKIYNSTVVAWGDSAALTSGDHPAVRTVFLVRTFFSNGELPQGLLSNDFPPLVSDITLCVTNLRMLPDDLDEKWAQGIQVGLEYAEFTSIPDVVLRLQPKLVSMSGSPVTSVPAALFKIQSLEFVVLGGTHVQELPRNVTRVSPRLTLLYLDGTNISTFWSWMNPFIQFQTLFGIKLFNAYGTPYCRELEQIDAGTHSRILSLSAADLASIMDVSTQEKLAFAKRVVDCTPPSPTHFPLLLEDAIHGLQ